MNKAHSSPLDPSRKSKSRAQDDSSPQQEDSSRTTQHIPFKSCIAVVAYNFLSLATHSNSPNIP